MPSTAPERFDALTPWQSSAGAGPLLRGRRHDGPPAMLHFLHGNGFCGGVYWPMLQHLSGDYSLFCHDLEGHGDSDEPQRFAGADRLIARIPQVIADQGLAQRPDGGALIGIGHSYGAALTMRVAAANPSLFKALVLLDPILLPDRYYYGTRLLA
ncbi:MAG: alpha/beta hydrolase, partial [Solimonas sp.]